MTFGLKNLPVSIPTMNRFDLTNPRNKYSLIELIAHVPAVHLQRYGYLKVINNIPGVDVSSPIIGIMIVRLNWHTETCHLHKPQTEISEYNISQRELTFCVCSNLQYSPRIMNV